MLIDLGRPDLTGNGPHTYHPNTFGLLYGKTTKTACSKRVATGTLVSPLNASCTDCQNVILTAMHETQALYNTALEMAKSQGYESIEAWNAAHKQ